MTYEPPLAALMVSSYTSSHSTGLVDPSYFLIPDGLKFRGQHTLFKSWGKALVQGAHAPDTSFLSGHVHICRG
jgi:hypothetical protein